MINSYYREGDPREYSEVELRRMYRKGVVTARTPFSLEPGGKLHALINHIPDLSKQPETTHEGESM